MKAQIHDQADDQRDARALDVGQREVVHRVCGRGRIQEAACDIRDFIHRQVRREAQNRHNRRAQEERQRGELAHVRFFRLIGNLLRRVLLPEQADIQLDHVRARQAAGEQVNPFRAAVEQRQRAHALFREQLGVFHNALVNQRLGDVTGEAGTPIRPTAPIRNAKCRIGFLRPNPRTSFKFSLCRFM